MTNDHEDDVMGGGYPEAIPKVDHSTEDLMRALGVIAQAPPIEGVVAAAFPERNVQQDLRIMVPPHLWDGIAEYVLHGREQGGFLTAVFENNLMRAATRADHMNNPQLADIARFVIWHCPAICYGSPAKVQAWLDSGGMSKLSTQVPG